MTTALVGLLSALIGAVSGLAGARLTTRANSRDQMERHRLEQLAEREREARVAVGQLAAMMSRAIQTIDWFAWRAARRPSGFTAATIDEYDNEIQQQFPLLMEAMARVAALSPGAFDQFGRLSERVFKIDRDVSDTASEFTSDPSGALERIAANEDRSDRLFWELQNKLAAWAAAAHSTSPPSSPPEGQRQPGNPTG